MTVYVVFVDFEFRRVFAKESDAQAYVDSFGESADAYYETANVD